MTSTWPSYRLGHRQLLHYVPGTTTSNSLGIVDPAQFLNRLDTLLEERGEGFLGLAFAAASSSDVHAAFPDSTQPPKDLGRLLELPEGDVTPCFSLVHFNPEATPGLATFSCTHLTPEMLRRPEWLDHPNGAIGLDGVTVAADDPAALVPAYTALFGASAVQSGQGRLEVKVGTHTLRFLSPDRLARRYPGLGGAPVMTVLSAIWKPTRVLRGGNEHSPGGRRRRPPCYSPNRRLEPCWSSSEG